MAKTIVGLFSTEAQARQVKEAFIQEGYEGSNIKVIADDGDASGTSTGSGIAGMGEKIKHFFSSLSGGDDDAHEHYATGVNAGGSLVAVTTEDDEADEAAALLEERGARNIDQTGAAGTAKSGQTAIPIIEEELVVGKREVDRGGVRVYSHVVERPVEADVTLRDEFINVERRFVDRPATAADFAAGHGSVIEMNASGEEAVVGKTARVVEEVLVGKESSHRTEVVSDSVRKTQVEVEEIAGETATAGAGSKISRF